MWLSSCGTPVAKGYAVVSAAARSLLVNGGIHPHLLAQHGTCRACCGSVVPVETAATAPPPGAKYATEVGAFYVYLATVEPQEDSHTFPRPEFHPRNGC